MISHSPFLLEAEQTSFPQPFLMHHVLLDFPNIHFPYLHYIGMQYFHLKEPEEVN